MVGEEDPAQEFQNMLARKIVGILQQMGYTPKGQPGAASTIDPSQVQQIVYQVAQKVAPGYLQKIAPGYVNKLVAAKSAELQEIAQRAVAEAMESNPDITQVNLKAQLILTEMEKIPAAIEECRRQLEQITQSAFAGYPSKEEVGTWKKAYEGAKKAFENMTAAYNKMGASNQAKEKELAVLKTAIQEAKNTFEALKPVYEEMVVSNKAKEDAEKAKETAYQALQSTVERLEGRVNALDGLEGRIVQAVEKKVREVLAEAPSGTGGEDIRVAATSEVDAYLKSEAGREMIEGKIDETFEKRYGIKPGALRKVIRIVLEQAKPEEIEEAEAVEETSTSAALPQKPAEEGTEPGGYLASSGTVPRGGESKKKAKKKRKDKKT
jgi:hypothetical protein